MDEFSLIDTFFGSIAHHRKDVVLGIGDDAACLQVPEGMQLVVSCDTLVAGVHFLSTWDAYDIACRSVMVNVSDMAAMGATPSWVVLALTLPTLDPQWLRKFSQGLQDSLNHYGIALVGGDTTRGPLSITLTIHGFVPSGRVVRRSGASPGDKIYVSGPLGAAAFALQCPERPDISVKEQSILMQALLHPNPRVDLCDELLSFATSAIDISDGLSADLNHICDASRVGATVVFDQIPVHALVKKYSVKNALDFALSGGDDYELCFTVPERREELLRARLTQAGLKCYSIGVIEANAGIRAIDQNKNCVPLVIEGYRHF